MRNDQHQYWASVGEDEIADNILDKIDMYNKFLAMTGRLDLYRRVYAYVYRARSTGARLVAAGDVGELTTISVNHLRNLLCHIATMTTQQKVSFQTQSSNTDSKSVAQTILGASLLDYYSREKKFDAIFGQAVWDALVFAEGFIQIEWDASMGKKYGMTETGATVYEGDLKYRNFGPLDVIRDITMTTPINSEWEFLRTFENKYNLVAKFPDLKEEILNDAIDMLEVARTTVTSILDLEDSDLIPVYTLLHKPTPALPQGRYTTILDNRTVMMDGPIPYKHTHVYRIAPDEESGTIFGFSVAYDMLPIQEAYDMIASTITSNQATFGIQNILAPKGHDLSTSQIAGSLCLMEYDSKLGKPEALNLTHTPPEIFNFLGILEKLLETISGVNSVARGNPEGGLRDASGAALALLQSLAIQFNQKLQNSYAALVGDVGLGTIQMLQTFAVVPRIATIVGKSNRSYMKDFIGKDLDGIDRVFADMGNPLAGTVSGRMTLAEQMMKFNLIQDPEQYIQVMTTGKLDPIIDGAESQLNLIKAENELLQDGKPVRALITDMHNEHITDHLIILASPEVRADPNSVIVTETLKHVQEHIGMLQSGSPILLITKQQALPPPQQPAPQQPAPGPTPSSLPQQAVPTSPEPPVEMKAAGIKQPDLPHPPRGTDQRSAEIINQQRGA